MGDKFEEQQVSAYQRIVKDYPLSIHAEDAKAQLQVMKRTVPEADPVALQREKYELENRTKRSVLSKSLGIFSGHPDMSTAAKSGTPPMEGYRPSIPASVPPTARDNQLGTNDVTIGQPGGDTAAIDKSPDVRANAGGTETPAAATPAAATTPATATAEPSKAPDPNETAKAASMTPAQQKKAYKDALKKQTDAVKKAQADRKKKEAEREQAVREQKKKSKDQQKQDQQKPDQKPPATGGADPAAPAKQ
jgi:hypothetical protein